MLSRLSQKIIFVSCDLFSVIFLLLSIPDRKPLLLQLNRVILTFKFVLLVGATPMRLKFILDPLPCMLIPLRLCSLGICSFMVNSRVFFLHT